MTSISTPRHHEGPLSLKNPGRPRPFPTVWDHRRHLAALSAGDHGHITMPTADRRLIHQQDPTRTDPPLLPNLSASGTNQCHDPMPTHPMMTSQPACQPPLEPVMILQMASPTNSSARTAAVATPTSCAGRSPQGHEPASPSCPTPCNSGTHNEDTATTPGSTPPRPPSGQQNPPEPHAHPHPTSADERT